MRLIDADKLCEDLMTIWDTADKQKKADISEILARVVTPIVVSQPTADTEKHAHWVYKRTYDEAQEYNCSLCGQPLTTHIRELFNYCPNCGAKMGEGE